MGSFSEALEAAEREGLVESTDKFKIKEGANRIRIVSEPLRHMSNFPGQEPRLQWLMYVIDRRDGKIKPFFMSHAIFRHIAGFQTSEEFSFEEELPPYDIYVNAENAGTLQAKYSVVPARKNEPLTAEELAELAQKRPIQEVQAAILAKQTKEHDDDIPV